MLIVSSTINWQTLSQVLALVPEVKKPGKLDLASFLQLIESLSQADSSSILRTLSFTILIASDNTTLLDVLIHSNLKAIDIPNNSGKTFLLISGNLLEWKEAMINFCSSKATTEMRTIFDYLYKIFEKEGLSHLWVDYKARKHSDGTFYLELR